MRLVYSENLSAHTLPAGHRFPMGKYRQIYEALAPDAGAFFQHAGRAAFADIALVHDDTYITAVRTGTLPTADVRRLGFPWSDGIVERARWSVGGTLTALSWALATGAAGHLAGGKHHAFAGRGEGFCVFNDLAVAVAVARRDHGVRRVAIVDLDVHQGNGTAALFARDPDVFTLSLHGANNYPFRKEPGCLDVDLPDGCEDDAYLHALDAALEQVRGFRPDLLVYQAGVDALAGDRFGRLALTHRGLLRRDQRVFALAKQMATPLLVTLGGGYHPSIDASVTAHANVYRGLLTAFR